MPRTYFQDFLRDDGSPVTVEYSVHRGEVDITDVMPNTPEFDALCAQSLEACRVSGDWSPGSTPVDAQIKAAKDAIDLTAAECDRMLAWLAEHHDA